MKSKLSPLVVILCALCASSAFARIGETEAQIEKRYGKAVEHLQDDGDAITNGTRQKFSFKGFTIIVTFVSGKSECEAIWKPTESTIDADEIKGLLAANASDGQTWQVTGRVNGMLKWKRDDGRVFANYVGGTMTFLTRDLDRKINATIDEIHAEKTKGF